MKKTVVTLVLAFIIGMSVFLLAATPQWIQYNERVVGENSPYYTDVVNRPTKQIWANFTTQHTTNGGHKGSIFPTPIPTLPPPTPAPTATPFGGPFPTPFPTATPFGGPFPTPIPTLPNPTPAPTATPASTTHFTDMTMHGKNLNVPVMLSTNQTIPYTYCYGQVLLLDGGSRTITLPSKSDLDTYNAHSVTFVNTVANAQTLVAGVGTHFIAGGGLNYTQLVSPAAIGTAITLRYIEGGEAWVVITGYSGAWTPS